MMRTNFEPMFSRVVAELFPSVKDFRVDYDAENVLPMEYEDRRGRKAIEYPPVACWRVDGMRFSYALKPRFLKSGCGERADYSAEHDKLLQTLQGSINHVTEAQYAR